MWSQTRQFPKTTHWYVVMGYHWQLFSTGLGYDIVKREGSLWCVVNSASFRESYFCSKDIHMWKPHICHHIYRMCHRRDTGGAEVNHNIPDSKVHGANMGPIWGLQVPGGPYVGPMNFAIWDVTPEGVSPKVIFYKKCPKCRETCSNATK